MNHRREGKRGSKPSSWCRHPWPPYALTLDAVHHRSAVPPISSSTSTAALMQCSYIVLRCTASRSLFSASITIDHIGNSSDRLILTVSHLSLDLLL
ncbi:hypothetical protein U1Q18_038110 [Sarracenia purpurea var. burkii]